jgi:hypothetical protein
MAVNTDLIVAGLDFDTIRANLRNYISSKPEFTDYDFADSALGTLLDLLAYNTYYNAFYANMAMNESFLDTAQKYDSVVSHAKKLGYTPTSARGATANIQMFFPTTVANSTFRSIAIPKNTKFTTTVNGSAYTFVTPQTYTISANTSDGFNGYINIIEGEPLTHRYVFNRNANTSFILPNENVEVDSITVSVTTSGNVQTYIPANDILTVNSSSQVFFVEADREYKYKVSFGDDVLGKLPATTSIVAISYRVCNGENPNGANTYSATDNTIGGQSFSIEPIGRATGGANIENIESVRFNAPRLYETQNRSVTATDHERIILRENPDIQAISVWGGEENDPPIYGKVFISAKPKTGIALSISRKNEIRDIVRKYNVQSIDVELVDPTYLFIVPYVDVRYNKIATTKTAGELASDVSQKIIDFEYEYLSNFAKKFRYSRFLTYVDSTNDSFVSTIADIRIKKTLVPSLTNVSTYTINFNNAIQKIGDAAGAGTSISYGCLTSSPFVYAEKECFFDDNGYGILRIYYVSGSSVLGREYLSTNIGTINYETGTVTINNFLPSSFTGSSISIIVAPRYPNVEPLRNQILLISQSHVNIIDDSTGKVVSTSSNIDTAGQTATILTPTVKLYNY